jgi:hypothetical protein
VLGNTAVAFDWTRLFDLPPVVGQSLLAILVAAMAHLTRARVAGVQTTVETRLTAVETHLRDQDTTVQLLTDLLHDRIAPRSYPPKE